MGCDILISVDEDFSTISKIKVENKDRTHGFSSFKFMPDTDDNVILTIKTREVGEQISSFIQAFETLTGKSLMNEVSIPGDYKFEGIEFL